MVVTAENEASIMGKDKQEEQIDSNEQANNGCNEQYPLQYSWALWHNGPKKQAQWAKPKYVCSFATVGQFWRIFNNLSTPSSLTVGSDFHLFKDNITPEWEDPANQGGGQWQIYFEPPDKATLDTNWFHIILTVIGNNFEGLDNLICGVVASVRLRKNRLQLWIRAQEDKDIRKIGRIFKTCCNDRPVQYTAFDKEKLGSMTI